MPIAPSFVTKLDRAEKHLIDLEAAIEEFSGTSPATRPYTVRTRIEGKKKREVHRLYFTRSAENTDIPLIAADAIYNMRSSLEHLMCSLVASKDRDSVTFPVFWRGVWNDFVEGENAQRRKDRQRWQTIVNAVPEEVLARLKRLQPPDDPVDNQTAHGLRILNQLSNNDRHTKLPVFADGVEGLMIRWRLPDGSTVNGFAPADANHFLENEAEIRGVPKGAMYVESYGPAHVVIRTALRNENGPVNLPVVPFIRDNLAFIREKVVPPLLPYVHPGPKPKRSGKRR